MTVRLRPKNAKGKLPALAVSGPFGAVIARNGEIVVALVEDSATVKRFYKENGHFRLQPENDDYEPIIVDSVEILGKVISVVRSYD